MSGEQMEFQDAFVDMRDGKQLRRRAWVSLAYVSAQYPDAQSMNTLPYLYGVTKSGARAPWAPSQPDLFGDDWEVVYVD